MYQQSSGYNFVKQYAQSLVAEIDVLFLPEVIFKELGVEQYFINFSTKSNERFTIYI